MDKTALYSYTPTVWLVGEEETCRLCEGTDVFSPIYPTAYIVSLHWQLFVKATRLEQIQRDYDRAEENQKIMQNNIERNQTVS